MTRRGKAIRVNTWKKTWRSPLSHEEALAFVTEVLKSWSPTYLSEDEALELAMSEEIAEWNLDLD